MPYTSGKGVRIYYETEGEGPPLIMGHGGGDSLEMWRRTGYAQALRDEFRIILLDFRGHGRSESSGEHVAPGGGIADDVIAVMDDIELEKAGFFGYSAGASAGFALALEHADRFNSFVLGGMTPYAWPETMVKAVQVSIDLYRLLLSEPEQYLFRMERMLGHRLTEEDKEHFLSQNAEARIVGLSSLVDKPPMTDEQLRMMGTPCLLYCGDQDPFFPGAREAANHMPRVRFLALPGLNHISALIRRDLVLPYIREFLEQTTA